MRSEACGTKDWTKRLTLLASESVAGKRYAQINFSGLLLKVIHIPLKMFSGIFLCIIFADCVLL
jgi:hypothetical protein